MNDDIRSDLDPVRGDTAAAGFSSKQKAVLGAVLAATVMFTIDITIVTVALPEIGDGLSGATLGSLQWVIIAYTLTFGSLLQISGSLCDILGVRRVLLTGTLVFAVGSLACGLAMSMSFLIGARALQGVGAAVMFAAIMPLLAKTFDESTRARAIGYWAGVVGVAGVIAPAVGGVLVDLAGWRSMFLINLPVAVVTLVLIRTRVDDDRDPARRFVLRDFDIVGSVLLAGALTMLNLGVVRAQSDGWSSPAPLGALAGAVVLFVLFAVWETRARRPILDLGLLRSRVFVGVSALALLNRIATVGGSVYLVLLLQDGYRYSPSNTGLLLIPVGLASMVAAIWAGKAQARVPARTLMIAGFAGLAVASAVVAWQLSGQQSPPLLIPVLALWGAANGLANTPIMAVTTASVAPDRVGMATGLVNSFFPIGAGIGTAALGSVFAARAGTDDVPTLSSATSAVYVVIVVIMVVATAVAAGLPRRRPAVSES